MRYLIIILLFMLNISAWGQELSLDDFVRELSIRQSRVEEFRHIKKIATELGIKNVYMFGGTAAAWGHYVRWDMRRELGIESFQPERFDYDYTNIFRSNQDFDVVIEGSFEQASALEKAVQKKFNYFSGDRPSWEVRILDKKRNDKESLLSADFQNQHSDSHSTGLIEMLDCEGFECVKDVRDLNNKRPAFLLDLFKAQLTYYFSSTHKTTSRYLNKMNPPILSVIRYFTKAVQYQLKQKPEDIAVLQGIIDEFNPSEESSWNSYVKKWLQKNAKKLIVNAIDMEFAQKLIESNGLKKKLISLGSTKHIGSMSWWLNKEALKSFPLGQGDGQTAAEVFSADKNGDIVISHETNSFSAYESITKSHDGSANVLISRKGVVGENAVHGDGHYTQIGREGRRGTGLTVRYKLDPSSRKGTDFISNAYGNVIVKNKNAIKFINEEINFTALEYFNMLANGYEFDFNDKGVEEKLKRKVSRKSALLTDKEIEEVEKKIISEYSLNSAVINEWTNIAQDKVINKKLPNHELVLDLSIIKDKIKKLQKSVHWKYLLVREKSRLFGALGTVALISWFGGCVTRYPPLHNLLGDVGIVLAAFPAIIGFIFTLSYTCGVHDFIVDKKRKIKSEPFSNINTEYTKKLPMKLSVIQSKPHLEGEMIGSRNLYKIEGIDSLRIEMTSNEESLKIKLIPAKSQAFPLNRYEKDLNRIKKQLWPSLCNEQYLK